MDHSIINNSELYIENLTNESWEHQPPGNIQTSLSRYKQYQMHTVIITSVSANKELFYILAIYMVCILFLLCRMYM